MMLPKIVQPGTEAQSNLSAPLTPFSLLCVFCQPVSLLPASTHYCGSLSLPSSFLPGLIPANPCQSQAALRRNMVASSQQVMEFGREGSKSEIHIPLSHYSHWKRKTVLGETSSPSCLSIDYLSGPLSN